jgi:hypothetical protein
MKVVDGYVSTEPCPFTMMPNASCGNPACTPGALTDSVICAMGGPRTGDKVRCTKPAVVLAAQPAPAPAPVAVVAEVLPASLVITIDSTYNQNPNSVLGKCHGAYTKLQGSTFYTKNGSESPITIQVVPTSERIETMVIKFGTGESGVTLKRTGVTAAFTFEVMYGTEATQTKMGTAVAGPVQAALPDYITVTAVNTTLSKYNGQYNKGTTSLVYTRALPASQLYTVRVITSASIRTLEVYDRALKTMTLIPVPTTPNNFSVSSSGGSVMLGAVVGTATVQVADTTCEVIAATYPNYMRNGSPCPPALTKNSSCTLTCAGRLASTITCGDNRTLSAGPVKCQSTTCSRNATFDNYLRVVGSTISAEKCPSTMQDGESCANPYCPENMRTASIKCDSRNTYASEGQTVSCVYNKPSLAVAAAATDSILVSGLSGANGKFNGTYRKGVQTDTTYTHTDKSDYTIKRKIVFTGSSDDKTMEVLDKTHFLRAVSLYLDRDDQRLSTFRVTVPTVPGSTIGTALLTQVGVALLSQDELVKRIKAEAEAQRCPVNRADYPGYMLGGAGATGECPTTLAFGGTCTLTCSGALTSTITCTGNKALDRPQVRCPQAIVLPAPAQDKCANTTYLNGYKLLSGATLSDQNCPTELVVGAACLSVCDGPTKSRKKVTCQADKTFKDETLVCADQKRCVVSQTKYPGYTLVGGKGAACPADIGIAESCETPCALTQSGVKVNGFGLKITCRADGSLLNIQGAACPAGAVNPPSAQEPPKCKLDDTKYSTYKKHDGFSEQLPPNPQPCPPQMDLDTYCSDPLCPGGTSSNRTSISCTDNGAGAAVTENQVRCTPDLSCARPDGYVASDYNYMTKGPAQAECPDRMDTGTRCIQKLCDATAGKKIVMCTDGKITMALTDIESCAAAPSTCSIGSEYTGYKRVHADVDPIAPCRSPMSVGDVCATLDCPTTGPNAGKRSTITCEKETGATAANLTMKAAGQVPCDFVAPHADVLVAQLGHVSTEATNKADMSKTIADGVKTELDGATKKVDATDANLAAVDPKIGEAKTTLLTDPTNTVLQQKVNELTAQKTALTTERDQARKDTRDLTESLEVATATATRDAATADTARDNLAAAQANIGGALPSASDTTLACNELTPLGVVCAKTGVSWFVSINRGTFQVSVSVYRQLDGSWVGYGAQGAPGTPGAPPWKGVYVTIKPSASRSVPHSVTCVWHYPQPSQTTTVSYTAGVPSTSGAHFQYQLSPTTLQEAAFLSVATSVTMFNGNLFPLWPAEATISATATNAPVSSSGGLSTEAIVGIVIASVVVLALIIGLLFAMRGSARRARGLDYE